MPIKLIADSGSTKTDWRLIQADGRIKQMKSAGLNPYFHTEASVRESLNQEVLPHLSGINVDELYFYGAGCSAEKPKAFLADIFSTLFPQAKIEVEEDLLAAVHSLLGNKKGIVAILGTGANACIAENGHVLHQLPSLGYILGDEGSGAYLGKELLRMHLLGKLPKDLSQRLEEKFALTRDGVIQQVYKEPFPNRYLASFAKWIFQNREHPFLRKLVKDAFCAFFENYVVIYPDYKSLTFNATGSIAFYFSALLKEAASAYDIHTGLITESPIAGLTLYHTGEI